MITLQITQLEDNENYDEEMEEYKKWNGYANRDGRLMPERSIIKNVLSVTITKEQFNAIRKAVLEVF